MRRDRPAAGTVSDLAEGVTADRPKCPVNLDAVVSHWVGHDLLCRAGRREFNLDRYMVAPIRNGGDLRKSLDEFLGRARRHEKTGLFAIVGGAAAKAPTAREELALLADIVCEAGLVATPDEALSGSDVRLPVDTLCPVTGVPAVYSFFPVAFCRNAANPEDELYDVSLSCPWTAINTTSDGFAFALMVRDRSRRVFGVDPYDIGDAEKVRALFDWGVTAWQNMSMGTIQAFSKLSVRPERAVGLSPDARYWTAPHQDPVFAETAKERYAHEMPVIYGRALATKWFAALFEGLSFEAGREGQAGGERIPDGVKWVHELQRLSIS
jgi:hypothetical protein